MNMHSPTLSYPHLTYPKHTLTPTPSDLTKRERGREGRERKEERNTTTSSLLSNSATTQKPPYTTTHHPLQEWELE